MKIMIISLFEKLVTVKIRRERQYLWNVIVSNCDLHYLPGHKKSLLETIHLNRCFTCMFILMQIKFIFIWSFTHKDLF